MDSGLALRAPRNDIVRRRTALFHIHIFGHNRLLAAFSLKGSSVHRAIQAINLALLILFALSCDQTRALVGADLADRAVQRYTVVIASGNGRCSGVLLAQDIILTAAHCVEGKPKMQIIGSTFPASVLGLVVKTVPHPLYKSGEVNSPDLAILKLAKPLPDRFIPAVINPRGLNTGDHVIAAGYGKSSANDRAVGTVLRMVLLRVSQSSREWATLVRVGEDASVAGPGDSGGPVFAYRGMHSVVALMVGAGLDQTRAVQLSAHYGWIRDTMQKLSAP